MNTEPKFHLLPIPEDGTIYTLSKFIERVHLHLFMSYDGVGYYATKDQESNVMIEFRELLLGKAPKWATHVCWYNK